MPYVEKPPEISETTFDPNALLEYAARKDVQDFIKHANEKYLYWSELKRRPLPPGTKPEVLWAICKVLRALDAQTITLKRTALVIEYKVTNAILQKLNEFDLYLGGNLETDVVPSLDKEKYLMSSLMEEAIASSMLEGAATTRKAAKDMLRTGRKPKNESEKMILNNYKTIGMINDLKGQPLTPELILRLQKSITEGTLEDSRYEGTFRDTNDILVVDKMTGEVTHTPPDFQQIPAMIQDVCDFANDKTEFIHPIIKASILHFLIGYVHPFVDGNGRTARALFYWYLVSNGYWLMEFISISRTIIKAPSQYAQAYIFSEKDGNDVTYFLDFQLRALEKAWIDLKGYIKRKTKEKEQLYMFLKIKGINDRQAEILKVVSSSPQKPLTFKEVQNRFNVVYETARADILSLEKMGFLERQQIGKRRLVFFRSKDFDAVLARNTR